MSNHEGSIINSSQGAFIVLEGIDQSLVNKQVSLLAHKLSSDGHSVLVIDPNNLNQTSPYVNNLKAGVYGKLKDINPYISTLMYSMHRYDYKREIEHALEQGYVVLSSGYTSRQLLTLSPLLRTSEERHGYCLWVDTIEYQLMRLPRPTINLLLLTYLDRSNNKDKARYDTYQDVIRLFPKDFRLLDCVRKKQTIEDTHIQKLLYEQVVTLIRPPLSADKGTLEYIDRAIHNPATQKKELYVSNVAILDVIQQNTPKYPLPIVNDMTYYVPKNIPDSLIGRYSDFVATSINAYDDLKNKLYEYLAQHIDIKLSLQTIENIAQSVLPTSIKRELQITEKDLKHIATSLAELHELGCKEIPGDVTTRRLHKKLENTPYSSDSSVVQLVFHSPKNELRLINNILFKASGLSDEEITNSVSLWTYEEKAQTLVSGLSNKGYLDTISYTWEITLPLTILTELPAYINNASWQFQQLTPRFGYEVEDIIDKAGLADTIEVCFDNSFKLYSDVLAKSVHGGAEYCLLLGHKNRVKLTLTAQHLCSALLRADIPDYVQSLLKMLLATIESVHPLVYQSLIKHSDQRER